MYIYIYVCVYVFLLVLYLGFAIVFCDWEAGVERWFLRGVGEGEVR